MHNSNIGIKSFFQGILTSKIYYSFYSPLWFVIAPWCGYALWRHSVVLQRVVAPWHCFLVSPHGVALWHRFLVASLRDISLWRRSRWWISLDFWCYHSVVIVLHIVFAQKLIGIYASNRTYCSLCLPVCPGNNSLFFYKTYVSQLMFKSLI